MVYQCDDFLAAKPRWVKFGVWLGGIAAPAYTVVYSLMNEPYQNTKVISRQC